MNNEMKRRVFIGTSIAALAGFPFVLRSLTGGRRELPKSDYQNNLERCRRLVQYTTEPAEGPEVFEWKISPPEKEVKYLSFLESVCVPFGESRDRQPDVFYLSEGSMSFEIAKKAIDEHLRSKQPDNLGAVSFYGGEPLLEFDLLKDSVLYAEEQSLRLGKKPTFTITTNGTLLNDTIIHFLVEHEFLVMISLDGPKEAHDRYRIFAGNDGRKGSFDSVMKNIDRFVELYPEYRRRGLSMTLAPPILWNETEELVQRLFPSFPVTRVSLVNTNGRKETRSCAEQTDCQKSYHSDDLELSTEDEAIFHAEFLKYQQALCKYNMEDLLKIMPFHSLLFSPALRAIHERLVTSRPLPNTFIVPCMPGYSRRFCDIHGNYFSCERVDNSKRYLLGNIESGYDAQAASKLIRWFNETTDCGNCVSMKTCNLCYAAIPLADSELPIIKNQLKHSCRQLRDNTPNILRKYVEIMERNPNAFDSDEESNENSQITFLPKNNRQ